MEYAQAFFLYIAILKLSDALSVLGVWYLCWFLRFDINIFPITKGMPNFGDYSEVSLPLMLVFTTVFHTIGAYRRDRIRFGFRAAKKIVHGSILGTMAFISICYFRGEVQYSRLYLIIFIVLLVFVLLFERALMETIWRIAQRGIIRRLRVLIIGEGELLEMYLRQIDHRKPYPVEWVGQLGRKASLPASIKLPYLGEESRLNQIMKSMHIDSVVISYPTEENAKYRDVLSALSTQLVDVKVLPDFGKYSTFTYCAEQEFGIPLLMFNQTPVGATDRVIKRCMDLAGSLFLLFVLSPLYLLIACIIKLTSRGPVLYSQKRMGVDGRIFTLYKFRSMRTDAEDQTGAVWATPNDSRTTAIGKWLRRTNLDELPQLFNVFKGDMSLVGPRPERPVFVDQFKQEIPKYMLRHKMKSGLTGWAQVNGWRGNTSVEERIKHDLYYIGHWSLFFDVKILCLTLIKGFENAY
jgi:exopolysaccharide biosynthesis polyprenyl glycosylphosphotransferase